MSSLEAQQPDITNLLAGVRASDEIAWQRLYDLYFEFVFSVARKLGTPAEELEDVVQEVFLVVYRKISDFKEGLFTTWLYRICANIVSDRHKRRKRRKAPARPPAA